MAAHGDLVARARHRRRPSTRFDVDSQVELAEILFEGTRSKGCGVVQFAQITEAETAIGKYQNTILLSLLVICLLVY